VCVMQAASDILNIMQIYYSIILFGNRDTILHQSHWPVFQDFFIFIFSIRSSGCVVDQVRDSFFIFT